MEKKRAILVRFDDICPKMDWEQWERAVKILKRYDVKPLIGVIPDCQDEELQINAPRPDFWQYIKELQNKGYTVAMHGYLHKYDIAAHGIVNVTPHSEFAGHPYEEQCQKIRHGKAILEQHGIFTDIFFAPAHSYDENTLKALAANGFRYLSDGKSNRPLYREGILCIPCRSSGCPKIRKNGYYTAVFHAHEWVRPEKADGYIQLEKLCEEYSKDIVSFEEYCKRPEGNAIMQKLNEKGYLFYEYTVKPVLRPIVRPVKEVLLKRIHRFRFSAKGD